MDTVLDTVLDMKVVEKALGEKHNELKTLIEKSNHEIATIGEVQGDTKKGVDAVSVKCTELGDRIHELEQKAVNGGGGNAAALSIGERFVESNAWQSMASGNQKSAKLEIKAAIINATGQNQPLVPADHRPGIVHEPNQMLTVRDLLSMGFTSSNMIEYAKENVFTNSAGSQATENTAKPESGITFTLENAPVVTIAHWLPASRQVLEDSPMLQSYINDRLMYGLKLQEEEQLLNGNGTSGTLDGLLNQATAYAPPSPVRGTQLDILRDAIKQAQLSYYKPDAVVLNPTDLAEIDLITDSQNRYIASNPRVAQDSPLWGIPVIVSNNIAAGSFLLGSFAMGAQIWDRNQAAVEVSRENQDNFVKNMVTILAEERLAFTVYRPAAFIKGTL